MKKVVAALAGVALVSTPAVGQVRPADCVPVLPVMDDVAAVAPLDVVAEPFVPAAARRAFFGLPLLLPLLAAAGGLVVATDNDNDNDDDDEVVSPA